MLILLFARVHSSRQSKKTGAAVTLSLENRLLYLEINAQMYTRRQKYYRVTTMVAILTSIISLIPARRGDHPIAFFSGNYLLAYITCQAQQSYPRLHGGYYTIRVPSPDLGVGAMADALDIARYSARYTPRQHLLQLYQQTTATKKRNKFYCCCSKRRVIKRPILRRVRERLLTGE